MGSHNPPSWGPASLLTHRSVFGSDITSRYCQFHSFKTHLLEGGFHTLTGNDLFFSRADVGSHNLPLRSLESLLVHHPTFGSNTTRDLAHM